MPDQMSKDVVDRINDNSRRSLHCKVKRNYNVACACIYCKTFHVQNDKSIGFMCRKCGKYNNVEKAIKQYEDGDYVVDENKSIEAPSIRGERTEYSKLREEFEIRADYFAQGKTRDSMGLDKFSNSLRRDLKKAKAFRGTEKTGL